MYKSLPDRFRGLNLTEVAEKTGLPEQSLREIAGLVPETPPRAATAGEAVALAQFFDTTPEKILHKQVAEELDAAGYTPPKNKAPEPTRAGARSPADAPIPRRSRDRSVSW